jgi:Tfp pilus assembly protein PilN
MVSTTAINFFREQHRASESQEKLDLLVMKIGLAAAGVSLALVVAGVGWWQYQVRQLNVLKEQQAQQARIIAQSSESEVQYLSFVIRLDELAKLLQDRNSKKEALDFLSLLARPTVSFNGIAYAAREKQLTFSVRATSVFAVEEFLESLRQDAVRAYYEEIDVSNISRDEEGGYTMEIIATLKVEQDDGR